MSLNLAALVAGDINFIYCNKRKEVFSMFKSYFSKFSKPQNRKAGGILDIPFMPYASEDSAGVESYRSNVIVHRCISLIASSASHIPWNIYKEHGYSRKLLPQHKAVRLLKKPNAEKSGADFFTESISSLLLYGNSYILSSYSEPGQPFELYNLHPGTIEHITTRNKLIAYKYRLGGIEKTFKIDPISRISRILHLRNYNPSDQQNGLSSLSAASKPIHLHAKIMDWNKSLLKNAARPSGALVFQDGNGCIKASNATHKDLYY